MFGLEGNNAYYAMVLIGLAISGVIALLVLAPGWTRAGRVGQGRASGPGTPEPATWIEPPAASAPGEVEADATGESGGAAGGASGRW